MGQHAPKPLTRSEERAARAAAAKLARGESLTRDERRLLTRLERIRNHERREQAYRSVAKRDLVEWTGRSPQAVNSISREFGLEFDRSPVCLPDAIRATFDFLFKHRRLLGEIVAGDDPRTRELRRWQAVDAEEKAKARIRRRELEESNLLPAEEVHEKLGVLAGILNSAGEQLQKSCGNEAHAILNEAIDEFHDAIKRWYRETEAA